VRFDGCFVRGKGDLLAARAGRRYELELESTLAALDGSLVTAQGGGKEGAGSPAQVRLRRSTVVVSEHVLALKCGRDEDRHPGAPAAVQANCDGCLLAASAGRALVHLDGVESDEQVRQLVSWSAPAEARPTVYANVGAALLDVTPANSDRMPLPMPYDAEKWLAFTRERAAAAPFVRVRFAAGAAAKAQPADYAVRLLDPDPPPGAADCGAPTDRLPVAAEPAMYPVGGEG
jgi:hypothetical protein